MSASEIEKEAASVSPRTRRRQRARQAFLDAARRMVVAAGPAGLSLREVARQTDYSPAALYEYFDSRDALLDALIDEGFDELQQALVSMPDALPAHERLVALGLAYIEFARQRPETFELLFTHHTAKRKQLAEVQHGDNHYAIFRTAVTALLPEATARQTDFNTYSFWALVHGLAMLQITYLKHFDANFTRMDPAIIAQFINGLGTQPN